MRGPYAAAYGSEPGSRDFRAGEEILVTTQIKTPRSKSLVGFE
jgi:hypothetical protein